MAGLRSEVNWHVRHTMTILEAISTFRDWSAPWTFERSIRETIGSHSEEKKLFEELVLEASRADHWQTVDLGLGCKIAHAETKKIFPNVEDVVIASIVRAVSYDWR